MTYHEKNDLQFKIENIMHPGPEINPKCYSFRVRVRWRLG